MDTFMDKLAHKLTAQEMIKANTAADAEEMNRLKAQIKKYKEILDRMQQLVEESAQKLEKGAAKIENAKVDSGAINRLVQQSIGKIEQMQQNSGTLEELRTANDSLKAELRSELGKLAAGFEDIKADIEVTKAGIKDTRAGIEAAKSGIAETKSVIEKTRASIEGTQANLAESKAVIEESRIVNEELKAVVDNLKSNDEEKQAAIASQIKAVDENIHRECVKVYRNVQAVVVEENNKQIENLAYSLRDMKGKLGFILKLSIGALVVSVGGVVFQVLVYLNII